MLIIAMGFMLLLSNPKILYGQNHTFRFSETPLSEALTTVAKDLHITISFDSRRLKSVIIDKTIEASEPGEVLRQLLENTGYTFRFKYDNYLIVPENKTASDTIFSLTGIIYDYETGERLPYSNIRSNDARFSTSATGFGTFVLKKFDVPLHLKISYLGYNSIDTTLYLSDVISTCKFAMKRKSQVLKTVKVHAEKLKMIEPGNHAGHITINPKTIHSLPNFGETDVFRTLQLLPGIGYSEQSAELNIRGSTADQNLVLFDGFTLYNSDHFFNTFSSVNPYMVKNIQIYKGGFDARYGERVSAIIDITGKSGNKRKPAVYGGFNLISGNLTAELPLGDKMTLIAAGRTTYNSVYSTSLFKDFIEKQLPAIQTKNATILNTVKPEFRFYDYNTKISYLISDKQKLTMTTYGSKDYLNTENYSSKNRLNINTLDNNEWRNYGFSSSWLRQWKSGVYSRLVMGYSGYSNDYYNKTDISKELQDPKHKPYLPEKNNTFETKESNQLDDFSVSIKNSYQWKEKHHIDFGALVRRNEYLFYKDADNQFVYSDKREKAWLQSVFFQDDYSPIPEVSIKPGLRFNYFNRTNKIYAEPRFSVNYQPVKFLLLKAAAGKYFQYLNKVATTEEYGYNRDFWVLSDGKRHPVVSSNHWIGGINFTFNDFLIDIETYYKTTVGIQKYFFISPYLRHSDFQHYFPTDSTKPDRPPGVFSSGSGKAYGLDMLFRYEHSFYTGWISYSYSHSTQNFDFINNGNDIPSPYHRQHEINVANMFEAGNWKFSATFIYGTGLPYISSVEQISLRATSLSYSRTPNFKRVDISTEYSLHFRKFSLQLGISLINLFNWQNYYDVYTRSFDFEHTTFNETSLIDSQGFSPNISFHFKF